MRNALTLSIGVAMVMIVNTSVNTAFAGGPRMDWDERFEDIPGAPECWVDGFDNGKVDSFSQSRMMNVQTRGINITRGG